MSDRIQSIEELSLNAWPSLQMVYYDGWALRFAQRYTRRANPINPINPSSVELLEKIRHCEEVYAAMDQPAIFKVTPAVDALDKLLAEQGYREDARASVQTLSLDGLVAPRTDSITLSGKLTDS
jgi:N-acetylglutamate synthase